MQVNVYLEQVSGRLLSSQIEEENSFYGPFYNQLSMKSGNHGLTPQSAHYLFYSKQ